MPDKSLGFSIWAKDTAASTFTKLAAAVDGLERKLKDLDRTKADPEVTVQTARAQRDLDQFVATMRTKLAAAVRALPEIELTADSSDVDRELVAIRAKLAALRANIELDADPAAALAEIKALSTRLRELGAQSASVQVRADIAGALRGLGAVEAEARRLDGRNVRVKADVDGAPAAVAKLGALSAASNDTGSSFFSSANSFLHFAKSMSMVVAVVGLAGPVLGAIGTAIAALPAFLFAVAAPAAAVAVGLDGIQAAAQRLMVPFGQMKLAVSATFERGLTPVMQSLLPLFPMLTAGLQSMAGGLVNVARQTAAMVTSAVGVQQIGQIFAGVRVLIDGMAPAMAVFTQNLLTMAAAGIGEFSRLGQVFTAAAVQFRTMLAGLIDTGVFQAAVRGFVDIMGALLTVLNQVIGVAIRLGAQLATPIVQALTAVGNAIVALAPLMGLFGGAFLGLITMFSNAIVQLAPVITPIISVILGLAMTILNALMPPLLAFVNAIMSAALPVLTQLAVTIGSVLSTAITSLAPLWPVLVSAIQQLLAAVSPLIPQLAMLVTQLVNGLAPILPQLVGLFFSVVMALMPLLPPIIQLATMFVPVLIAVVQALVPVVTAVANAFLQVLGALMPMLPPIIQLVQTLLPPLLAVTQAVLPIVVALANAFMQVVMALMPLLPPIIQLASVVLPIMAGALATAAQILGAVLVPAINILGGALSWLIGVLVAVIGGIINFVATAIGWFQSFGATFGGIWNAILAVFSFVWNVMFSVATVIWTNISAFFTVAFQAFLAFFGFVWNFIVGVFTAVWTTIFAIATAVWNAISAFYTRVFVIFQAFFAVVWNAIGGTFALIWNVMYTVAVTIWNAISAFFATAFALFELAFAVVWNAVAAVFTGVWNWIRDTAIAIWTTIQTYFSVAFGIFTGFFRDTWNGILAFFVGIWVGIWGWVQYFWTLIKLYWDVALTVFRAFWGGIWNSIITFFTDIWNRIWGTVQYYWALIKLYYDVALAVFHKMWSDTWTGIVDTFSRIWNGITGIATRVWDTVKGIFVGSINWIIDKINGFLGAVNQIAGLLGFKIDLHVNRLGEGGSVQAGGSARGPTTGSSTAAGLAEGGPVGLAGGGNTRYRRGGRLPYTGQSRDTIPAVAGRQPYALMGQEYVVQRPAARALGSADLHKVNNAHRSPVDVIPRAGGGPVGRAVVAPDVAAVHTPFLTALASGQAEAVQAANFVGGPSAMVRKLNEGQGKATAAAGGEGATMDGYVKFKQPTEPVRVSTLATGGDVARWAAANQGGPYVWGGCSPRGSDCSGWVSALVNVARGNYPWSRLGATGSFPWPGLTPGLTSSFGIGAFKGNPGHTAATINGINAESGSGHGPMFGGVAHGANDRMFNLHASVPQVGGSYAPGPGGGGGGLPLARMALDALGLGRIRGELIPIRDDMLRGFGDRTGSGGAVKAIDFIYQKADELDAARSGGAMGATSNEAPGIVKIISDVARGRFGGMARKAAVTGTATGIVESGLRNLPGGDRDSVGVFQQRPSQGWGTVAQCMNVSYAAGKFFSRFPGNWASMDQGALAQSVQRSAFPAKYGQQMGNAEGLVARFGGFDNGGWLQPGLNMMQNSTGRTEGPVLPFTPKEWTNVIRGGTGGRAGSGDDYDRLAKTLAAELRADRSLIGSLTVQTTPNATAGEIIGGVSRELRLQRMGGVAR